MTLVEYAKCIKKNGTDNDVKASHAKTHSLSFFKAFAILVKALAHFQREPLNPFLLFFDSKDDHLKSRM